MMWNDAEYNLLIKNLAACKDTIQKDGYSILLKKIPDGDRPGDIDPRIANLNRFLNQNPGPSEIDLNNMAAVRACMNWKSLDITRALIETKHSHFVARDGQKVRIRIYTPIETEGIKPCMIYFHGGGWIGGEMSFVENACKVMAERAKAVVVSVDYRVAPENPFPIPFNDCVDSVRYVYEHGEELGIDPQKIGVSGDSAGANLATVCALYDRDNKLNMIKYQALVYPATNICQIENEYYTWSEDQYDLLHNVDDIKACIYDVAIHRGLAVIEKAYVQDHSLVRHPYVSPLYAEDFSGMAPIMIVTPEFDYLRLEGEAYAKRLAEAGVDVKVVRYCGVCHGFLEKVGQIPQAEDCCDMIAKDFIKVVSQ